MYPRVSPLSTTRSDNLANAAAFGAFANSGQICMSTERIIVDESIADAFVQRLANKARQLPLGDPRKGPVVLGSVVDTATVDRCNELIDDALAKGAKLLCGGKAMAASRRARLAKSAASSLPIARKPSPPRTGNINAAANSQRCRR